MFRIDNTRRYVYHCRFRSNLVIVKNSTIVKVTIVEIKRCSGIVGGRSDA